MARREISAGQKYQQIDSNSVWEVIDLSKDAEGVAHARLVRVGDPTTRKTISTTALRDNRLYRMIAE